MKSTLVPRAVAFSAITLLTHAASAQTGFFNWETPHVSPIALTPNGQTLLAVNAADNRLEVFSVSANALTRTRSIPVGLDPVSVRARDDNEAWVINHVSDSISIVNLPTGRVVRTILTADEPTDVVFAGNPLRAFVSISQLNQIRVFDPLNVGAAPLIVDIDGEEPRALSVSPDGTRVYATIFESGNKTSAVRQQDVSNPTGPYAGRNPPPNNGNAFNPPINPNLTAPPPPVGHIVRKTGTQWIDDNGRNWSTFVTWDMLDHDVAIINTANLAVSYADAIMTHVMGIGVKPDGTVTVVGTEALNQIRFEPIIQGVFMRVLLGAFNPAAPGAVTTTDLNPHLNYGVHSTSQSLRNQSIGDPRGIVWHPTNGRGYVTGMGSDNVIVIDGAGARQTQINVGQGPTGIAMTADGARLFVMNKFDASISVIDTASNIETARVAFFDPTPSAIRTGRPFLYNTHTTSGLGHTSCASCHIDGRTDFLAWDLGNPAGELKTVNQVCRQGQNCRPWHPMKGPMVTQSLQGIVGNEPFHWRGDRENVAAFDAAFTGLQGRDAVPTAAEMQQFTDFVATIHYQPNPNRNIDGTMPTTVTISGVTNGVPNTGNPNAGLNLYQTLPVLPGNVTCINCHALPAGTSRQIDDPMLPLAPQSVKQAQLRGLWEKDGWRRNLATNTKGFGFNHHSEFDTLRALLDAGFNFGPPNLQVQRKHDVEAFLVCFDSDTHAGVGQQITFDGTNNNNANAVTRLNTFVTLAEGGQASLVARGRVAGADRGYLYVGANVFQSDRAAELTNTTALRTGASAGNEITFTVVPNGTQRRIGIDRDADGWYDRDELDAGTDPANPASTPLTCAHSGDLNGDGLADGTDIQTFVERVLAGSTSAGDICRGDFSGNGVLDAADTTGFVNALRGQ